MSSIPPSGCICEAISEFFTKDISDSGDLTNNLFLLGAQRLIQEAIDYLGRSGTL